MRTGDPFRRRRLRKLFYGALFIALVALPPAVGITIFLVALAVRTGLAISRRAARFRAARSTEAGVGIGAELQSGRRVVLPDRALAAHGLVLGASGAGKTTTLLSVLSDQIERGRPVVVIDLKGSPALAEELRLASARAGRGLRVWTLDGGSWWNPLAAGNATELKDKLISTENFTEPHYKRAAERYLQTAIQVLQQTSGSDQVTLSGVVKLLDPLRLAATAASLERSRADQVRDYIKSLTPDQLSAIRGLASRLAILTESHTGRFLEPAPADALPELNVRRALDGGEVALFSLNSSTYGQLAAQLGTLAVQDLISASGARLRQNAGAPQAIVAIDEFSALGSDNVIALMARGRESRVGVLLATQELADLDRAARGLREQVLGNTAVKIAHRQDVPESARAVAQLAGTVKAWERTYTHRPGVFGQQTAGANARLVDKLVVEPEQIRSLQTGEAVMIFKSPRSSTHLARVLPRRQQRSAER